MAVIPPWTEPPLAYVTQHQLPDDQTGARRIVRHSKAYKVHEGELYKKSTIGVLQRCISEEEGQQLLAEIHTGMGEHHAAAWTLVSKAFRVGFFWSTTREDARTLVQHCVGCQLFANQSRMPPYSSSDNTDNLAFRGLGSRHGRAMLPLEHCVGFPLKRKG